MATPAPRAITGGAAAAPNGQSEIIPPAATLLQAARIATQDDYPIHLDYYADSLNGKAFMGEDDRTKERVLIKGDDEYTSEIHKVYKVGDDFIILTTNSLYIVSAKLQRKRYSLDNLQA